MTTPAIRKQAPGFTLIELLVVVAIFGVVSAAMYSVYLSHMKTAFSQEEVIDVQQNLRTALDVISRDLALAGTLLPPGSTPIAAPSGSPAFPNYSSSIRMTTGSADGCLARVSALPVAGSFMLSVDPPARTGDPNPVDRFNVNDYVRIVSPVDGASSVSLRVQGTDKTTNPPTITLNAEVPGDVAIGDMLAKTADGSPLPHSIDYFLVNGGTMVPAVEGYSCPKNQKCLVRRVTGGPDPSTGVAAVISSEIVATDLTSLRFAYVSDDDFLTPPTGEVVPSDRSKVRAVRVTLQGGTSRTAAFSGGARNRSISSMIKLRNRR